MRDLQGQAANLVAYLRGPFAPSDELAIATVALVLGMHRESECHMAVVAAAREFVDAIDDGGNSAKALRELVSAVRDMRAT